MSAAWAVLLLAFCSLLYGIARIEPLWVRAVLGLLLGFAAAMLVDRVEWKRRG